MYNPHRTCRSNEGLHLETVSQEEVLANGTSMFLTPRRRVQDLQRAMLG